jgi:hypothetical protein
MPHHGTLHRRAQQKFNLPLQHDAKVDQEAKAEASKSLAAQPSEIKLAAAWPP